MNNQLESIMLPTGRQLGVYFGSSIVVFNLPNLSGVFPDGGPAFDPNGPPDGWAEAISAVIHKQFGRGVAKEPLIACTFSQNMTGTTRIEHLAEWEFIPGFFGTLLDKNDPPKVVGELSSLLAMNTSDGPLGSLSIPKGSFHWSFGQNKELLGFMANGKFELIVRIDSVEFFLAKITALDHLAHKNSYIEGDMNSVVQIGAGKVTLSLDEAKTLRSVAGKMADEVRLYAMKHSPFQFSDQKVAILLEFLNRAALAKQTWHEGKREDKQDTSHDASLKDAREILDDIGRIKTLIDTSLAIGSFVADCTSGAPFLTLARSAYRIADRDRG